MGCLPASLGDGLCWLERVGGVREAVRENSLPPWRPPLLRAGSSERVAGAGWLPESKKSTGGQGECSSCFSSERGRLLVRLLTANHLVGNPVGRYRGR